MSNDNKKKSYEEVEELFNSKGLKLLDNIYVNNLTKMNCINSEGYKLVIGYSSLKENKHPRIFDTNNPHTIDNIKHYMELNRKNIELVEGQEYIGIKDKLKFKCLIHNKEFNMNWDNFQNGNGCPVCGIESRSSKLVLSIETIKQRIIDMGRDKEVELVSTEYVNANEKLIFKCLIHNKEFPMSWSNFSGNHGCPTCGIKKQSGENNWNWKGGISNLYEYLRTHILYWKIDSFKKYGGKCDITGYKKDCIIHHLHPFNEIIKEAMEALNLPIYKEVNQYKEEELKSIEDLCLELHYKYGLGVCLNEDVHKEFHSIYGVKNNTKEQYYEFKTNKHILIIDNIG